MKKFKLIFFAIILTALIVCTVIFLALPSSASYTEGLYTYTVTNGEATITDVDTSISGDIIIPSTLGGYPVTSIGNYAFYECTSLVSITIPDSVTNIGYDAFMACYKLVEVYNLSSLTITAGSTYNGYIGYYALNVYTSINEESKRHTTSEGYVFYVDGNTIYLIGYAGDETQLTLPDNYNGNSYTINKYAFYNCTSLESITIPDSVKSIGTSAFRKCTNLESVKIGNSVTSIGDNAFENCKSLQSITIPDSVESIGDDAFMSCGGAGAVYVTDIAAWCNISFGNSYSNPLHGAKNLYLNGTLVKDLVIPDSVESIGEYAFYNYNSLGSITIPDSVESIGKYAFYSCESLDSITIPDSVDNIGGCAFRGCLNLESVKIGNSVESIGNDAFENCKSLQSITIPDSVTSIGYLAFYGCTSLESLTIGKGVTSMGYGAFGNCTGLTEINFNATMMDDLTGEPSIYSMFSLAGQNSTGITVNIGANVTKIPAYLFFPNKNSHPYYSVGAAAKITSVVFASNSQCKEICASAFAYCTHLQSINIPDSVTSIGNSAFSGCTSLESIEIPNSVTSIGNSAFSGCTSLESIEIPNSVESIGNSAFADCTGLAEVHISDMEAWCSITFNYWQSNPLSYANSLYLNGTLVTDLIIPNNVEKIGGYTFCCYENLISVTIPDSVKSIEVNAFACCPKLVNITIGAGVENIDFLTFRQCTNLANITVKENNKSYHSNGNCLIETETKTLVVGCNNSVIPTDGSVTNIVDYAFENRTNLESITIPDSVESIGMCAFSGCTGLESVTMGDGVKEIHGAAFSECTSLESITIPNSVESIGHHAFEDCISLKSITIGDGVESIGDQAFSDCIALTEINFNATKTDVLMPSYGWNYYYGVFQRAGQSAAGITVNIGANVTKIPDRLFDSYHGGDSYFPLIKNIVVAKNSQNEIRSYSVFGSYTDITIYCYSGSTAHEYAQRYSKNFVLLYDKNTATPLAPTAQSTTETSVTLTPISGYEYKIEGGEWQSSNIFSGLDLNTTYTFYQRIAQTSTVLASVGSETTQITTRNHVFTAQRTTSQYLVSNADCRHKTVYYYSCQECGLQHSATFEYGDVQHDYSNILTQDTDTHYYACSRCDSRLDESKHEHLIFYSNNNGTHSYECICGKILLTENCFGGIATCMERAICTVCYNGYGEFTGHDCHILRNDSDKHWYKCADCLAIDTAENHIYGAGNKCSVCGYEKSLETNITGDTPSTNDMNENAENVQETENYSIFDFSSLGSCGSNIGGAISVVAILGFVTAFVSKKRKES